MRTHNELIQVCLENFDEYFKHGICEMIHDLCKYDVIRIKEHDYLRRLILDAVPVDYHDTSFQAWPFYWKSREKEPRIEWLKSQLEPELSDTPMFDKILDYEPECNEPELEYPQ